MKKLLFIILLSVQSVFAGIIGDVEITGKVLKYNKRTVTLEYGLKKRITVPKRRVKEGTKIKTGQSATIIFTSSDIVELLRQQNSNDKKN